MFLRHTFWMVSPRQGARLHATPVGEFLGADVIPAGSGIDDQQGNVTPNAIKNFQNAMHA